MGYITTFKNKFSLNKELDNITFNFLKELNYTRRMKRSLPPWFGVDGEFYVKGSGFMGQERESDIVEYNNPPASQPSLWCQWTPTDDMMHIEWDGGEKFYPYIEWIKYIISKVLAPRGYVLNGNVDWQGEENGDTGTIDIVDNVVMGERLITDYSINDLLGKVPKGACQPGFRTDGKKTKHQVAKEKQEALVNTLKDQILSLETQLKAKKAEEKVAKKLTVKDLMLIKIMNEGKFGGNLDDFKIMLRNLLED